MKNYPLEKYKFIINEEKRQIIAITHDAGKTVRGIAKCSPNDTFDIEYGKKLAAARANMKVAMRQYERANKSFTRASAAQREAIIRVSTVEHFLRDSFDNLEDARQPLINLDVEPLDI